MAKKSKYYVRPDGLHESIRTIDGKRVAFRGKTDREVDRKILEYRQQLSRGRKVSVIAREWWNTREPELAPASQMAYSHPLDKLVERFGDLYCSQVRPLDLQRELEAMKDRGFRLGTVKLQLTIYKQVFRYAVRQGDCDISPAAELELPKKLPRKTRDALTDEQIKAVMACRDGDFWLFGLVLLYTGLRRGEALALSYEDIDRKAGVIHINKIVDYGNTQRRPILKYHTKTDAGMRDIPLFPALAAIIPAGRIGLIFHGAEGGPMSSTELDRRWRAYCKLLGFWECQDGPEGGREVFPITPHYFRHTFATLCYDAGIDPKSTAHMMGHASEQLTMELYTHLSKTRERTAGEQLGAYLEKLAQEE